MADGYLKARVRDDLKDVLGVDSAEIVIGSVAMLIERGATIGGEALFAELEDTLSNFLTLGSRSQTVSGDPETLINTLAFEHLSPRP